MAAINEAAMQLPPVGQVVMITFEVEGKTICIAGRVGEANFSEGNSFSLTAPIFGANFLAGIDRRLDQQRRSIERLLEHLKHHCPALQGKGMLSCPHYGQEPL
jgi:hypothetical protein